MAGNKNENYREKIKNLVISALLFIIWNGNWARVVA